ncbi:glycoside hydrolase family protein [Sphingobium cloacae]|nr:hypothetical protein [Sphingobium cloacae]
MSAPLLPAADAPVYFAHEQAGIGDPNPFYENGVYSVFYLKNEGRHPFWLTQSRDGLTWSPPSESIPAGKADEPDFWTGSGSVIADPKGGYRLYYTGHHPHADPKEVVMEARAPALTGPWTKHPETAFAGSPAYDRRDFRDPFLFWNAEAKAWWMLLATRRRGKAVIGLYSSADLTQWTARPPIYEEDSPLNLEVPDLFREGGDWYLLYSDQREESRQVRYLAASRSAGPYVYRRFDALDGRAFYAGKSAGSGDRRLLFGWLAHKKRHDDAMDFDWGGDLVVHALRRNARGDLAVSLPETVAAQFRRERRTLSPQALEIGSAAQPLLARMTLQVRPGSAFGILLREAGQEPSRIRIDTARGEARFLLRGRDSAQAPRVAFPPSADGRYALDLVVDPKLGLGIAYINGFRALSFRFYHIGNSRLSLTMDGEPVALSGVVTTR